MRIPLVLLGFILSLASAAPAAAQAVVRIGLSVPLTGADAGFGQGLRSGAEQAVADLNRAGPRRYALVVADDSGEPRQAAAVAARFAAESVAVVIGPFESSAVAAALPIYERAGTVLISPGATYGPLTARGAWNLFRLGASDPQQARAAAEYLFKAYPGRPIGLVNDRTTFGRSLADGVAARLRELGQREAVSEAFDQGSPDLTAVVRRLAEAQVAAVYFGGLAPEAVSLVRAMRDAKLDATLVASDGILDPAFAALGAAGDGTVMTMAPEPPRLPEPPGAKALLRTPEANAVAAGAYAAVQVFAQAIDREPVVDPRTGRADGRKLAQTLRSGSWKTVLGPVGFDKQGDQSGGAVVLRVWRSLSDGRLDFAGQDVPAGLRPATGGPALN
ncbi:MAG: branched-chain amino acid ABC transporter substrate-binding protein [Parafilimonas terrae]|nr:branched-chain amino acid ABC transporter substrate-binding protein [Parafilimonas terrae]